MKREQHGKAHSSEYGTWQAMKARCQNPNFTGYANYGGRGIKVCERWQSFKAFYEDMGPKPSLNHTLDRIDVDSDYTPDNCRWLTRQEQQFNKRPNRRVALQGRTQTITEWCRQFGVTRNSVFSRLRRGREEQEALTTPITPKRATRRITFAGKSLTIRDWAKEVGMNYYTLKYRFDQGWTVEDALTTPTLPPRPRPKRYG